RNPLYGAVARGAAWQRTHGRELVALPVDLLDVVVHRRREHLTALRAARLEHLAPNARAVALAKSVHANPTTFLRLVGTLWHDRFPLSKNAHKGASSTIRWGSARPSAAARRGPAPRKREGKYSVSPLPGQACVSCTNSSSARTDCRLDDRNHHCDLVTEWCC